MGLPEDGDAAIVRGMADSTRRAAGGRGRDDGALAILLAAAIAGAIGGGLAVVSTVALTSTAVGDPSPTQQPAFEVTYDQ